MATQREVEAREYMAVEELSMDDLVDKIAALTAAKEAAEDREKGLREALAEAKAYNDRQATKLAEARKEIASQKQTHERWVEMEREARQNRNFWAEKAVMSQAELAWNRADARRLDWLEQNRFDVIPGMPKEPRMAKAAKIKHEGRWHDRTEHANPREKAFSDQWQHENKNYEILRVLLKDNGTLDPIQMLAPITQVEATNAATVIQWLGSNVGFDFLRLSLERCGYVMGAKGAAK